ncbi:ADP-ribosyltransferase, partial [Nocardiopsis sp. LOL_012]|uniref:ADP-ribosyltransferase n=1 Tax=Nocardiopsis sp. LOL_012 TaxID=3345409 RepID=UPI003A87E41C
KRPYDPNGLLDLPFPENPRPRTEAAPDTTPEQHTAPTTHTTPWPTPPHWEPAPDNDTTQDPQTFTTPGTGAIYLSMNMAPPPTDDTTTATLRDLATHTTTNLNHTLRHGPDHAPTHDTATVTELDTLIHTSTTPAPLQVHHRPDPQLLHRLLGADPTNPASMHALTGRTYTDPGYTTATTTPTDPDHHHPITLTTTLPAGYPALNTADLTRSPLGSTTDLLLRRQTTVRITNVRHTPDDLYGNDHWHLHADIIPTPPPDTHNT